MNIIQEKIAEATALLQSIEKDFSESGVENIGVNDVGYLINELDTMKSYLSKLLSFDVRVAEWCVNTFGEDVAFNKNERNYRFLEESLELVQCLGLTVDEAHELVDYVFDRPWGQPYQEVGGVMVTLGALCAANDLNSVDCGENELIRCKINAVEILNKQKTKVCSIMKGEDNE